MRNKDTIKNRVVWPQDGRSAYRIVARGQSTIAGRMSGWRRRVWSVRKWLLFFSLYMIVWAAAAYHFGCKPEQYQAHTVLSVVAQGSQRPLAAFRAIHLETVFHNVAVAEEIVQQNRLDQDTQFLTGLAKNRFGKVPVDGLARALLHCVSVNYEPKTGQAYIFFTHPNPSVSVALANDCAEEYIKRSRDALGNFEDANDRFLLEAGKPSRHQQDLKGVSTALQSSRLSSSDAGTAKIHLLDIALPPQSETVLMQQRATKATSIQMQMVETYVLGFTGGSLALLAGMITNSGVRSAPTNERWNT